MQELHVLVELNLPRPLDTHFDVKVVSFLKQYWTHYDWDSIMDWMNSNGVLEHLRLNAVRNIIIYGVAHVLRHCLHKSLLVNLVVIKDLHHGYETALPLRSIEANLPYLVLVLVDGVFDVMV